IVGDQLDASSDVRIERLAVERDRSGEAIDRRIGLPLGLIVAVVTDSRGNLAFSLPVAGKLGSPGFSFGGAVMSALKTALVNLVAGPLGAVGWVFRRAAGVGE